MFYYIVQEPYYNDVIMGAVASQITSLTIVYSTVDSDADQRKHQSSASLAFVRGNHKWPVTRKMFPFDDVIMCRPVITHSCLGFVGGYIILISKGARGFFLFDIDNASSVHIGRVEEFHLVDKGNTWTLSLKVHKKNILGLCREIVLFEHGQNILLLSIALSWKHYLKKQ